jgi:hypothetical protein
MYRVEITSEGIRIRNIPFKSRNIPFEQITSVRDQVGPLIYTRSGTARIWGLDSRTRPKFVRMLPHTIRVEEARVGTWDAVKVSAYLSRATGLLLLFTVVGAGTLVPFLDNGRWHDQWVPWGQTLLIATGLSFIALLPCAVMAWTFRISKRETTK